MKNKYYGHGGLILVDENADRREYIAEGERPPRWYRRVTKMYPNKKAMHSGLVASIGFEWKPENRIATTCVKYEIRRVQIRK